MSKYKKFVSVNPKLEDIKLNTPYLISLNSRETFPNLKHWEQHYCQLICDSIFPIIKKIIIYPELSPSGRLHYHGAVIFTSYRQLIQWYTKGTHPDININISGVPPATAKTKYKNWLEYSTKQQFIWLNQKQIRAKLTERNVKKIAKPTGNKQIFQKSVLDHLIPD